MSPKAKKIVAAIAIMATIGVTGYVVYRVVQKNKKTKSGNPTKDNRKIIFTK